MLEFQIISMVPNCSKQNNYEFTLRNAFYLALLSDPESQVTCVFQLQKDLS